MVRSSDNSSSCQTWPETPKTCLLLTGLVYLFVNISERALYAMEISFHPLFNMTTGQCRLDYRRPENRLVAFEIKKKLEAV